MRMPVRGGKLPTHEMPTLAGQSGWVKALVSGHLGIQQPCSSHGEVALLPCGHLWE